MSSTYPPPPSTQSLVQQPLISLISQAAGLTHTGQVRTSNEDNFLIAELGRTLWVRQTSLDQSAKYHGRSRGQIFLVADGMGGAQAGEVASALSVETVEGFVLELLRRFTHIQRVDEAQVLTDLADALRQADARIVAAEEESPELAGMGTTLTMAFASGRKLFVIHAGDSRCYLFRRGKLEQLTQDHTLVAEMVRGGVISPEEARRHRARHVVTNVLGGGQAGVRAKVRREDLEPGDVILLCSDGLTEMVEDEQIAAVLGQQADPATACAQLVALANDRGGKDNVTVVIARFEAVQEPAGRLHATLPPG